MKAREIEEYLEKPNRHLDANVLDVLSKLKEQAVANKDEYTANYLWCLQQVYKIQSSYLTAFERMKAGKFEDAWNALDRTDIEISFLDPHFEKYFGCSVGLKFYIGPILNAVKQFQKLFPYRLFFSREDIIKEEKCSICGKKISLRYGCNHRIGQLYMGEMCCHEITDMEFLAEAIVTDPFDKYTIIHVEGQEYNYYLLEQLMNVVTDPFTLWNVDELEVMRPEYKNIGRNDLCPCGSGKKYKKCCLRTDKIYTKHYRISLANRESGDIQPLTFYNTVRNKDGYSSFERRCRRKRIVSK
jgi:hypothetical protein